MEGEPHGDQSDQQQPEQLYQLWTPDQEIGQLVSGFPFRNGEIRMLFEMNTPKNLERFDAWLDDLEEKQT